MEVRRIDPGRRRDVRRFLRVPLELYRGSEQWVPLPLAVSRLDLDRRRHPFYEHSDAAFFVAEVSGRAVGRVTAFEHRIFNDYHGRRWAFFGHFDSIDDPVVAALLLDAAAEWAQERGLEHLVGPRGLLGSDATGVLVEGFEHRAAMGANYNHPYYDALIRACGFEKETDFVTGRELRRDNHLPEQFFAMADAAREQLGLRVEVFTSRRSAPRWEQQVGDAYNAAFADNWEFAPVTPAEITMINNTLLWSSGSAFLVALFRGDEVAGFMFIPVDITRALQRARGRIYPFAWISLLRAVRTARYANVNGLGLRPRYQGTGAAAVLFAELVRLAEENARFDGADVMHIKEDHTRMLQSLEAIGIPFHKRHRIYGRNLV